MADNAENGSPAQPGADQGQNPTEHLNIKVTDNNNEVFFKIKRSTKLEKLMTAFCERQGKTIASVRFLFEGQRVQPSDTPETVSPLPAPPLFGFLRWSPPLQPAPRTDACHSGSSSRCKTVTPSRSTKSRSAAAKKPRLDSPTDQRQGREKRQDMGTEGQKDDRLRPRPSRLIFGMGRKWAGYSWFLLQTWPHS